jgi:UDPglucose 6-dehydrogenase
VLAEMMRVETRAKFVVVNNPEFLKEGSAVVDFMRPDRVVVGHCGGEEESIMNELYAPLVMQGNPIFHMSNLSAELTKYAANCFLAMKISFINEMARLCDACGADIEEVRKGITSDARIGGAFLYPGPGYGGSCFPKDVRAMMNIAKNYQTEMKIVTATDEVNIEQKSYIFKKILNHFKGDLKGKVFAMWGVSFKPNTDDIRESASIEIAENIVRHGGSVRFYDPVAAKNFAELMSELKLSGVEGVTNKYDALNKSDACIVLTDWSEFKAPDFAEMKLRLKSPILFDFRNLYKSRTLIDQGFTYYSIGKRSVP